MKKEEFLNELEKELQGLPKSDIIDKLSFYSEMIDDRIEEGKTEEEAIADLGGTDKVVGKIVEETPITSLVKERIRPKKSPSFLTVLLLILGFPLWLPLFLVFMVLVLVFILLLWILVIVTYSVEAALLGGGVYAIICLLAQAMAGNFNIGYLGLALAGIGGGFAFLSVCFYSTKLTAKISKAVLRGIKRKLIGGKKNA